jgi:hypothetical protein
VLSQFVAPAFFTIKNHIKMTSYLHNLPTEAIKETNEDLLTRDVNYFLTEARNGDESQDGTYYVSQQTYENMADYIRVLKTRDLHLPIEIEYDENDGDDFFTIVYPYQVGPYTYHEYRFKVINLDRAFAAVVIERQRDAARSEQERIHFPL